MFKQLRKKLTVLIFIFFITPSLFYADGVMWGEKNIRVIKTEWFDIIFAEGSRQSAERLAQNADSIYYEIAAMYGTTPQARMPVVLSPNRETANAYFSVQYYNHIVIYDTASSEELEVFSDDLLSTFRHELTHAFTYNTKNKFWTGFDKVFGDAVNPAGLFITAGWSEGATVTSESVNGEGRLNDEYAKHVVKQAKIENKFPKYDDIQGASDKYPEGAYYIFNGMFNEWLQKKYGMEKYAAFWYKCVNFKTFTTRGAFRKIYGIKLIKAWEQFKDELLVPDTPPNPIEKFAIKDFFNESKENYSIKNKSGAVFTSVTACDNYIAWLEQKSKSVFIISKTEALKEKPKPKKLFSINGAQKISLSQDGRYLAISYINQQKPNYTCRIKIYDLQKKKWIYRKETGVSEAAILQCNDEYYLICRNFYSQSKKIVINKLENKKISQNADENAVQIEIPLAINTSANDFIDIGGGHFAFIKRTGIERSLCFANVQGEIIYEAKLPYERMVIKNLSYDNIANKIYFSYTIPPREEQLGNLPRLAEFDIAEKTFACDKNDISGGIFYPVKLSENEFFYVGKFYRQNRLFKLDAANVLVENQDDYTVSATALIDTPNIASDAASPNENLSQEVKYNPFKYFGKGLFLPVAIVPSYSYDPRRENFGTTRYLWFGATYITNNPWNSNTFTLSAGYNPFTNSGGVLFSANGGSDDALFKWKAQSTSEFDFDGWKQSDVTGGISVFVPFGKISAITFSENINVFAGRGNNMRYEYDGENLTVYSYPYEWFPTSTDQRKVFYANNNVSLYYTNIHQTGEELFEKGGVSFGIAFLYETAFDIEDYDLYNDAAKELSPFIRAAIPKLIPIKCKDFFVYNLPFTLTLTAFDKADHFLTASADVVLFSMDIQKAIPGLTAIFVNRFYLSAGYSISTLREKSYFGIAKTTELAQDLFSGNFSYNDYIHFDGTLALTPNFGIFANPICLTEFKFQMRYYFNRPADYTNNLKLLFNLGTNLKF